MVTVIINHFNKDILPGGYLGVDIFFVISGYVITSSLYGRPSKDFKDFISGFYERRIKRLVPALSVFILITSITICLFNPSPLLSLRTGLTSLLGLSNIYLLKQSTDYFAQSTEFNVFTHTWSLGVEEQFYILFPFLIWFTGFGKQKKHGARNLFLAIGVLAIASLIGFFYLYNTNQSAAYFLMPTRFWEMATGCLIFIGFEKRASIEQLLEKVPPLLVVASIVGVMYLPKSWAIASTVSVVVLSSVLIASLKKQTAAFKIFTNPKVVYVGLISYSLYLWHWGVLSISRWTIGIHWWSVPFQVALMLILAIISYRWIETPLRKSTWFGKRWKTLTAGGGVLVALSGGLFALSKIPDGVFYRGDFTAATVDDYSEHFLASRVKCSMKNYSKSNCLVPSARGSNQTMLLFGDSHAGHLIPLMGEIYANTDINFNISISYNYPQLLQSNNEGTTISASRKHMANANQLFNNFTDKMEDRDIVVLSSRWEHHLFEDFYNLEHSSRFRKLFSDSGNAINHTEAIKIFQNKLDEIAKRLDAKGISLVIFSPLPVFRGIENPAPSWACTKEWFRPFVDKDCSLQFQESRKNIDNRNKTILDALKSVERKNGNVYMYDPFNLLCPDETVCETAVGKRQLFRDDDHLSRAGSKYLYKHFLDFLRKNKLMSSMSAILRIQT